MRRPWLSGSADVDHCQVPIAAGATVTATLQSASAQGNVDLAALNLFNGLINSSSLGLGQADVLRLKNSGSTASAFLLRVKRGLGGTATGFGYTLAITSP